jgi:hypothetical protein
MIPFYTQNKIIPPNNSIISKLITNNFIFSPPNNSNNKKLTPLYFSTLSNFMDHSSIEKQESSS